MPQPAATDFESALLETLSHMRDVSTRDGVQSWYANQASIQTILPIIRELDTLAAMVKAKGGDFPPVEAWGGGQVLQPAQFLFENTYNNLEDIAAAAPHTDVQFLYRGRQGLGFFPVSREVQFDIMEKAGTRGARTVRIFDMMNDDTNLDNGFDAVKAYNKNHPGSPMRIEGAISYISEPEGKVRVWTLDDYGTYAVKLAEKGADEIAIKDYAGVGDKEMKDLIGAIRAKLDKTPYKGIKINVHSHGRKPEVLADALEAGADKVDVAFGRLSDGPSHTNIMDVVKTVLKRKGFDVEGAYKAQFDANPIVRQIKAVEQVVGEQCAIVEKSTVTVQGKQQPVTRMVDMGAEKANTYRMAGGALSDLRSGRYMNDKKLPGYVQLWKDKIAKLPPEERQKAFDAIPKNMDQWFERVLQACPALWEKAGRFNTVTPGAMILCQQAEQIADNKLIGGEPVLMTDYTPAYLDVVVGRYGRNKGMENDPATGLPKMPEAVKFRDAVLIFRALGKLNNAVSKGSVSQADAYLLVAQGLAAGNPLRLNVESGTGLVKLKDPGLEEFLKASSVDRFRQHIEKSLLGQDIKEQMLAELTPSKSPEPAQTLADGHAIIAEAGYSAEKANIVVPHNGVALHNGSSNGNGHPARKSAIANPDDLASLALVLQKKDGKGDMDNRIITNLITHHLGQGAGAGTAGGTPRRAEVFSRNGDSVKTGAMRQ